MSYRVGIKAAILRLFNLAYDAAGAVLSLKSSPAAQQYLSIFGGASSNLKLTNDGTNSFVSHDPAGAGILYLGAKTTTDFRIEGTTGNFRPGVDGTQAIGDATHNLSKLFTLTAKLKPTAFASLPAAAEGDVASCSDSNTAVWGAAIAAGGANKVLAYFNGTAWTVAGK